jgi:hypothetical protein
MSRLIALRPLGSVLVLAALLAVGCDRPAPEPAPLKTSDLPSDDELRAMLDRALDYTLQNRRLSSDRHAAWQIMHGALAYGRDFKVEHEGQLVPAVDWALDGGPMKGFILRKGDAGVISVLEPGTKTGQGHADQWLAIIAQCDVPSSREVVVGDEKFTLGDLLKQSMWDLHEGQEASWTIIGLSHYLPLDATWQAKDGSEWTLERLIAMEAAADINGAACGGSHRLIGMTMALNRYKKAHPGEPLTGGWKAAQERIDWAIQTARQNQQPNGAFSTHYFSRPGNSPDLAAHMGASGHTLEFISLALDEEQLDQPWIVAAADYLCGVFEKTKQVDMECGALYHAAHGLAIYRQRRFGPRDVQHEPIAQARETR